MSVRAVVVGAGMMGKLHAAAWAALPGARLAAVVDPRLEVARPLAERYGARVFPSLEPALEGADVVSICTPPQLHRDQVVAATNAGLHVLLEKPASPTLEDHDAMQAAVEAAGVRLMVGMTHRFYPESRAAANYLASGRAGAIIAMREQVALDATNLPDWYFDRRVAVGGVLLTNGIHAIDRFLWLAGANGATLQRTHLRNLERRGDVEDFAEVDMVLDNGVPAHLLLLWQPGASGEARLDIVCQRASLRIDSWQGLTIFADTGTEERRFYHPDLDFMARTLIGIRGEVKAFLDAIENHTPLVSDLAENRRAFALIDEVYHRTQEVKP